MSLTRTTIGAIGLAAAIALPLLVAEGAFAQGAPSQNTNPQTIGAPSGAGPNADPRAAGQGASAPAGDSHLTVATVKLTQGTRASKLIGASVYNDQQQSVGTVDDLVLDAGNKAVLAVVSVGGFLGIGSKLVAVPFDHLHLDDGRLTLPGATKEALNGMPGFTYKG